MPTAIPSSIPPDSTPAVSSATNADNPVNIDDELCRAIADCSAQVWDTAEPRELQLTISHAILSPNHPKFILAIYHTGNGKTHITMAARNPCHKTSPSVAARMPPTLYTPMHLPPTPNRVLRETREEGVGRTGKGAAGLSQRKASKHPKSTKKATVNSHLLEPYARSFLASPNPNDVLVPEISDLYRRNRKKWEEQRTEIEATVGNCGYWRKRREVWMGMVKGMRKTSKKKTLQ